MANPFPAQIPSPSLSKSDGEMLPGDGSSATSSVLGDGPGSSEPFRASIQAMNRPCSPTALTTALLSIKAVGSESEGEEEGDEGSESNDGDTALDGSGAEPVAGSSSGDGSDAAPLSPLLQQSLRAPPTLIPLPPLGPLPSAHSELSLAAADPLHASQLPAPAVATSDLGAEPLGGTRAGPRPRPQPPPIPHVPEAGGAGTTPVVAAATPVAAAVVGPTIDLVRFRRNQSELNRIRAQLKALKGKDLANYQRGMYVEGQNSKSGPRTQTQHSARQVFVKKSQPTSIGPTANSASFRPSLDVRQPPPPLPKPWVTAVGSKLDEKRFTLKFRPPKVVNGEIIVEACDETLHMARNRWSDYLVGHFLEGRLPFPSVDDIANRMWAKHGLVETLSYEKEFFLFKFPEASSREKLLDHGPFLFGGRPLILQQWTPSLVLSKARLSKIPLWVKIYNIPLAMWNPIGLGDIASAIGVPLFADSTTEKLQRFEFARICVEVDASKPLLNEFKLRIQGEVVTLQVVYQWRPKRCPSCCTFGHLCPQVSPPSGPRPALAVNPMAPPSAPGLTPTVPAADADPTLVRTTAIAAVPSAAVASNHAAVPFVAAAQHHAAVPTITADPAAVLTAVSPSAVPTAAADPNQTSAGPRSVHLVAAPRPTTAPVQTLTSAPAAALGPTLASASAAAGSGAVPTAVAGPRYADPDCLVDGLVEEASDEEDFEDSFHSAMYYTAHSPKTRGQKAMRELSLIPPQPKGSKGSGKKGKKRGKRAKR